MSDHLNALIRTLYNEIMIKLTHFYNLFDIRHILVILKRNYPILL